MALRKKHHLLGVLILVALAVALPGIRARADGGQPATTSLPSLHSFVSQLENGHPQELRGVYAPGVFALSVMQQPAGDTGYVAPQSGVLTQFAAASRLGSTGLLAHNFSSGALFASLKNRQFIYLVYGDGRTVPYVVRWRRSYQALQPDSPFSGFVNLSTGQEIGAASVFSEVYGRSGAVIFQTCIDAEGIQTWGRLFVIAVPESDVASLFHSGPYPF